jgi:hypothetical protein
MSLGKQLPTCRRFVVPLSSGSISPNIYKHIWFCGLWDLGVPSSKDEVVPVRNMCHVVKTYGTGGTAHGIHKLCFRWRRKISFTHHLFYPTPDERATGSHWIEVLIGPLFPFFPPVTGRTAIIYSRFHLLRSALDILNLEDESTALSRNFGL